SIRYYRSSASLDQRVARARFSFCVGFRSGWLVARPGDAAPAAEPERLYTHRYVGVSFTVDGRLAFAVGLYHRHCAGIGTAGLDRRAGLRSMATLPPPRTRARRRTLRAVRVGYRARLQRGTGH